MFNRGITLIFPTGKFIVIGAVQYADHGDIILHTLR